MEHALPAIGDLTMRQRFGGTAGSHEHGRQVGVRVDVVGPCDQRAAKPCPCRFQAMAFECDHAEVVERFREVGLELDGRFEALDRERFIAFLASGHAPSEQGIDRIGVDR